MIVRRIFFRPCLELVALTHGQAPHLSIEPFLKMQKDNTGSKGGSSPTATGLHVLSIGGTNAEFDVRVATALCSRRKYVIYTVAETSEAYRAHIEEIMQNDIIQELLNSRRLQFRDETSRRPRVHRLTDLVFLTIVCI